MQVAPHHHTRAIVHVKTQKDFDDQLSLIKPEQTLALDLEFDKDRFQYGFTLCLIQLATPEVCLVIDPFEVKQLSKLFEMLENPNTPKVMHAAGEDIKLLHSLNCFPQNVFDTDIAVRFLNYAKSSLSATVEQIFGVQIDKSLQKSNWTHRPLTPAHITYAANDVLYLHHLKEIFEVQLTQAGLASMVAEENLYALRKQSYKNSQTTFWSKDEEKMFSEYDLHILNKLYAFRDEMAQKFNKPPFYIFSKEFAYEIINTESAAIEKITTLSGIHRSLRSLEGERILDTIYLDAANEAESLGLLKDKNKKRMSPEEHQLYLEQKRMGIEYKTTIVKPIQGWLAAKFGTYAASSVVSSQLLMQIVSGKMKISTIPLQYKQKLIKAAAQDLELDISRFI
ncbi:MAG: ribonuclease D [Cytophagales bacterium]|nr:MAG: ribonuclease D [Cytophagales bacterium]TAF60091.1 MAG: ribonuclease D [Cytophagales bacterium]